MNGTTIEALSSNLDDKTMHETYLWPFANAVRAGTASIMCSYQRINGSYGMSICIVFVCESAHIHARLPEQQGAEWTVER